MKRIGKRAGTLAKTGLAALGVAALAVPVASALAVAEDPTQAAAAELTAEQIDASRAIFNNFSCGACHVLGDAGATGQIGPTLDGNTNIDHDYIVRIVSDGQGAMPGFGGQISEEDIVLTGELTGTGCHHNTPHHASTR